MHEIMHSVREQLHMMYTSDERCTLANRAHHMLQTGDRFNFVKCCDIYMAHGPWVYTLHSDEKSKLVQ